MPFQSGKKYFLTGIDWFVHLFDYMASKATGVGNLFQIVAELDGEIHVDELRDCLDQIHRQNPILIGRIKRSLNLAPYYKPVHLSGNHANWLQVQSAKNESEAYEQIKVLANTPLANKYQRLEFVLINSPGSCKLIMRCDHHLFDARGAEAFLYKIHCLWKGKPL
ncbi:MAG: hypothetical protein ACOCZ2_03140, partial [Thermodesulfobacteriota bacterium]